MILKPRFYASDAIGWDPDTFAPFSVRHLAKVLAQDGRLAGWASISPLPPRLDGVYLRWRLGTSDWIDTVSGWSEPS